MFWPGNARSYVASACVHALVLTSLWGVKIGLSAAPAEIAVESTDLPAETASVVEPIQTFVASKTEDRAGQSSATAAVVGLASGSSGIGAGPPGAGGSGGAVGRGPRLDAVAASAAGSVPSRMHPINFSERVEEFVAQDLGERVVKGETGAPVGNYRQALSRIAQELIRMMREGPLLVVWIFDESESMRDDQVEIRACFHTVYEQIGLEISTDQTARTKKKSKTQEPLVAAVLGFSTQVDPVAPKPTSDLRALRESIDHLNVDHSGRENTAAAVRSCLEEYRGIAKRQKRRLAIVLVTDESGDDWEHLEDLLVHVRECRSPVFVLGREAIFGYPYAQVRWTDPVYGLTHWLPVNRGPETPMAECLQWDGLHGRWDAFSSGSGPYELARLAAESGGVYFVLPGDEQQLSGAGANEKRRLEFLDMKEYQPVLQARSEYEQERDASRLRSTVWAVITTLNPHLDPQLNLRELHYPVEPAAFREMASGELQKALRAMGLLNQAVQMLDRVEASRADEPSRRWRADYDLVRAQCLAYRVRLFQFLLALDQHGKAAPAPQKPTSNVWNVVRRREILPPDEEQIRQSNVDQKELATQEKRARDLFQRVITEHAGTPWARRAEHELSQGFGMWFDEGFLDPRYQEVGTKIKLPNL